MSTVTQRTDEKSAVSDTGIKKIITRTEEEKSRSERQEKTDKIITGTWDEISSYLPKDTPKPISATETRKLAYTTTTGDRVCPQHLIYFTFTLLLLFISLSRHFIISLIYSISVNFSFSLSFH